MHLDRIALALAFTALVGCGGSGSSTGGGGGGDDITWPDRGGGESTELPAAVQTGRVVFVSASGETCCVAVDPEMLAGSGSGLAVLTDLPSGPATVTVTGFATDFAPAVAGITTTCTTSPPEAAHVCDPVQVAAPAFESDPLPVNIIPGVQTNVGEVPMKSLPFLYEFSPPQGGDATQFVDFAFTVVDAVSNINHDSVALEVTFDVESEAVETQAVALEAPRSVFRSLTKRVDIKLEDCEDGSDTDPPCSAGNNLDLAGFKATGIAPELPEGPVEAHITAANTGAPPQPLDFRYSFNVIGTPLNTPTATPTADASDAAAASNASDPGSADGPSASGAQRRASDSSDRTPGVRASVPTPTPTFTPAP
ncbi:MAG: hypothetical protein ACRERC_17405 [Candidatus Binatia bacterium]